jgi:hypothetical protein
METKQKYKYFVKVYFKTNKEWVFPARDLGNARDIASRIVREGAWLGLENGDEEFYPTAEVHKAKVFKMER